MKKVTPFCNTWGIWGLLYIEEGIKLLHRNIGSSNGISHWRSVENFLRKTN